MVGSKKSSDAFRLPPLCAGVHVWIDGGTGAQPADTMGTAPEKSDKTALVNVGPLPYRYTTKPTDDNTAEYIRHWTHVRYVGEGAANVVFKSILVTGGKPKPNERDRTEVDLLNRYLIRAPKQAKNTSRRFLEPTAQIAYFLLDVLVCFDNKKNLFVDHRLCHIPDDTIKNMNNELAVMDRTILGIRQRPAKFVGDKVDCPGGWAILVEDMRERADRDNERTIEFKPKWLAQSPSAPDDANTCRCCALASKKYNDAGTSRDEKLSPGKYPCPLWLDPERGTPEGKEEVRRTAIKRIFKGDQHHTNLYKRLKELPTLSLLKKNQIRLDTRGPLQASKEDQDFSLAMTLRDCSLFVRYREVKDEEGRPSVGENSFEAKLADIDRKNAEWKVEEWKSKERSLIDEGWYTGRGKMTNCALWR